MLNFYAVFFVITYLTVAYNFNHPSHFATYLKSNIQDENKSVEPSSFSDSSIHDLYEKLKKKDRGTVDFTTLPPDDPLFLDMSWPTFTGPESSAYARHLLWKRSMSDGERKKWQKWAIYERSRQSHNHEYNLDDYVTQNMMRKLFQFAVESERKGKQTEGVLWRTALKSVKDDEIAVVEGVMKAFYSAFNRRKLDEIGLLWLPVTNCEVVLPGYSRVRGYKNVQPFFEKVIESNKPLGHINTTIVSIQSYGNIAIVYTIEEVRPPSKEYRTIRQRNMNRNKKESPPIYNEVGKRLFATTILRQNNMQWRILLHHVTKFQASTFTNDFTVNSEGNRNEKDTEYFENDLMEQLAVRLNPSLWRNMKESGKPSVQFTAEFEKDLSQRWSVDSYIPNPNSPMVPLDDAALINNGKDRLSGMVKTTTESTELNQNPVEMNGSMDKKELRIVKDDELDDEEESSNGSEESQKSKIIQNKSSSSSMRSFSFINENDSITKQTIQTLRYLFLVGRISREMKDRLLSEVIDSVYKKKKSWVVSAYELLLMDRSPSTKSNANRLKVDSAWSSSSPSISSSTVSYLEELDKTKKKNLLEFADQCDGMMERMMLMEEDQKKQKEFLHSFEQIALEAMSEDEDDDDDEDADADGDDMEVVDHLM